MGPKGACKGRRYLYIVYILYVLGSVVFNPPADAAFILFLIRPCDRNSRHKAPENTDISPKGSPTHAIVRPGDADGVDPRDHHRNGTIYAGVLRGSDSSGGLCAFSRCLGPMGLGGEPGRGERGDACQGFEAKQQLLQALVSFCPQVETLCRILLLGCEGHRRGILLLGCEGPCLANCPSAFGGLAVVAIKVGAVSDVLYRSRRPSQTNYS